MKKHLYLSFTLLICGAATLAQQEPKKEKKEEKSKPSSDPGHQKNKNGTTKRIDVSDQGQSTEKKGAKKPVNKDNAVLPKK
jgi:hypothetical protein